MELGRAEVGDSPAHMTCLKPLTTASSGFQGKAHNSGVQAFLLRELSSLQGASQWLSGIKKKKSTGNAGDAGDVGSIPGWGRSPGGELDSPLQYSCLEYPMDRGAWRATIHRVSKRETGLKRLSTTLRHP